MGYNQYIKKEIRIVGIDDAPFDKFSDKKCLIVASIFRGGNYMDGLLSTYVNVDGDDSTEKISDLIKKTRHYGQLNCIMLNGITMAGFNLIDINKLNKKTGLPVIVIIRKMPNLAKIKKALNKMGSEKKMGIIEKAGKIYEVKIKDRKIFMQTAGISAKKAAEIVKTATVHSLVPEPLRISHIIASGISEGESHGRA